jgi:hypothetical protein
LTACEDAISDPDAAVDTVGQTQPSKTAFRMGSFTISWHHAIASTGIALEAAPAARWVDGVIDDHERYHGELTELLEIAASAPR